MANREDIAITPSGAELITALCAEIARDVNPPHDEEQITPESLDAHLVNLRASAGEYAKALQSVGASEFPKQADAIVVALCEQLRAVVKLACRV